MLVHTLCLSSSTFLLVMDVMARTGAAILYHELMLAMESMHIRLT
jgi:hypothetical protein